MRQFATKGIILSRNNFGEADRILTILSLNFGKLKLIAKGVRRAKSKLAGGVELFSISDITFIRGRGEIGTLTSSRLDRHFGKIVKDIQKVGFGYEMLKLTDKNTEEEAESGYFELLKNSLAALDEFDLAITKTYFLANLLKLAGHMPNLETDEHNRPLAVGKKYGFDPQNAQFCAGEQYSSDSIKFLRLVFGGNSVKALSRVTGAPDLADSAQLILQSMLSLYLRV